MFNLVKYFHIGNWAVVQNKFSDLPNKQKKLLLIQDFKTPEFVIFLDLSGELLL